MDFHYAYNGNPALCGATTGYSTDTLHQFLSATHRDDLCEACVAVYLRVSARAEASGKPRYLLNGPGCVWAERAIQDRDDKAYLSARDPFRHSIDEQPLRSLHVSETPTTLRVDGRGDLLCVLELIEEVRGLKKMIGELLSRR